MTVGIIILVIAATVAYLLQKVKVNKSAVEDETPTAPVIEEDTTEAEEDTKEVEEVTKEVEEVAKKKKTTKNQK
jgi:hypothetical protein